MSDKKNKIIGKVIKINSPYEVVINKGQSDGVRFNQKYLIYEEGEELIDPDSKKSLGKLEIIKGHAKPKHIQEYMTTLISDDFDRYPPRKKIRTSSGISLLFPSSREEIYEEDMPNMKEFEDLKENDLVKLIM